MQLRIKKQILNSVGKKNHPKSVHRRFTVVSRSYISKTLNGSVPRYLEDILKFYHQSRTLRSSRDNLRLEEPNFNMKTYGQRAFSVAPPPTMEQAPL